MKPDTPQRYGTTTRFLLMVLSVWRVARAICFRHQRPKGSVAAKMGHGALYVMMLAVPASGIARQIGQAGQIHGALAFALLFFSLGHIVMTVYHHFKGEAVLPRMLGKV